MKDLGINLKDEKLQIVSNLCKICYDLYSQNWKRGKYLSIYL